jgi:hypothetical protein
MDLSTGIDDVDVAKELADPGHRLVLVLVFFWIDRYPFVSIWIVARDDLRSLSVQSPAHLGVARFVEAWRKCLMLCEYCLEGVDVEIGFDRLEVCVV